MLTKNLLLLLMINVDKIVVIGKFWVSEIIGAFELLVSEFYRVQKLDQDGNFSAIILDLEKLFY